MAKKQMQSVKGQKRQLSIIQCKQFFKRQAVDNQDKNNMDRMTTMQLSHIQRKKKKKPPTEKRNCE
jgi:hypothetical protein